MSNVSTTAMDAAACHNGNNFRKYKRGQPCQPKSKKQLENELNRQRSFFVASPQCRRLHDNTQEGYSNGNNSGVAGQKKPTLAIYRPPTNGPQKSKNHRDVSNTSEGGSNSKLNVNAKEFSLERSKTAPKSIMNGTKSENTPHRNGGAPPMLSRSRTFYTNSEYKPNGQRKSFDYKGYKNNFPPMKSTQQKESQYNPQGPKVQFNEPKQKPKPFSYDEAVKFAGPKNDFALRKSKSYNGPDSKHPLPSTPEETNPVRCKYRPSEFCVKDLSCFPEDINDIAKRIVKDAKNSPTKDLMLLALKIIEHAVGNQEAMNTSVDLSLYIIERDTRDTYVNMIINTVQLWFVKRDKLLQPPRFCSYATFVLHMYKGMKQNKVLLNRMEKEVYSRKQTLLMLLYKICEHCLTPSKEKRCATEEIECLSGIVTAVGRDLEQEVPDVLRHLYVSIRDAVLRADDLDLPPATKKTLLRLIELRASKWALPSSTADYYAPKTNI